MAERRDKVQVPRSDRRLVRLVLRALVLVGVVAPAMVFGSWGIEHLLDAEHFPLRVVRIDGQLQQLDRAELERAVARVARGGFFFVDVAAVRAAAQSLSWVEDVSVRRVWPDTLYLRVSEREPVARWNDKQLVNLRGEVFDRRPDDRLPAELPLLTGPEGTAKSVLDTYRAIQTRFESQGLKIRRLSLTAREDWSAELSDGTLILFGTQHLAARVETFMRAYPLLLNAAAGKVERVDLRYTNGIAVRRAPPESSPEGGAKGIARGASVRAPA